MGNIFNNIKNTRNIDYYEPFITTVQPRHSTEQYIQNLENTILLLTNNLSKQIEKQEKLEARIAQMEIQNADLFNKIAYYNQQHNEKINIITTDMENLINNDKILLDKLIEKNIISTIYTVT